MQVWSVLRLRLALEVIKRLSMCQCGVIERVKPAELAASFSCLWTSSVTRRECDHFVTCHLTTERGTADSTLTCLSAHSHTNHHYSKDIIISTKLSETREQKKDQNKSLYGVS